MARYAGLLLAPAEGFALQPKLYKKKYVFLKKSKIFFFKSSKLNSILLVLPIEEISL